jgi:hypothetical protein
MTVELETSRVGSQVAPPPMRSFTLPRGSRDEFQANGFLTIKGITTPAEIAAIKEIYDRLFAARTGWEKGDAFDFIGKDDGPAAFPAMFSLSSYEPALRETLLWSNIALAARELLDPAAEFVFEHGLCKPPLIGPLTPWHQDKAFYLAGIRHETISFWVPLQPVTADSGCMRFIPGSNRGPLYPHHPYKDDPRIHAIEAVGVDEGKAAYCPLEIGDAVVFHHMTLHGAGPNVSSETRRAYVVAFGVRRDKAIVTQDYPWNSVKQTAREARYKASLGRLERTNRVVRRQIKTMLLRMNWRRGGDDSGSPRGGATTS